MASPEQAARETDQDAGAAHAPAQSTVEILPVEDKAALDRFIKVPWRIYRDDPQYFGVMIADNDKNLLGIDEKPENPVGNLVSAGAFHLYRNLQPLPSSREKW